jgi:transposase
MPWKASSVMEERLRFVARLLDGEAMTEVCRDFAISRKTGYKIFDRYREHGLEALSGRGQGARHGRVTDLRGPEPLGDARALPAWNPTP